MTEKELKEIMRSTRKDVIRIHLTGLPTKITGSKIGGTPYWPKTEPYPNNMLFLTQINFEEVPKTDLLPKTGILQFFIENEDCYGLFNGKTGYKVVYHDTIGESASVFTIESDDSPILSPSAMMFRKDSELMSCSDRLFPEDAEDIESIYYDPDYAGAGDKLLGYPFFTQMDPREEDSPYDTLLFQLDSSDYVMWGDVGVANFFINENKLKACDFSDVLYNWDCC